MTIPPSNDENTTHDDGTARIWRSNSSTTHDDGIATTTTRRPNHEDNEREASHTSIRQANLKRLNHTRAYRHRLPIFQAQPPCVETNHGIMTPVKDATCTPIDDRYRPTTNTYSSPKTHTVRFGHVICSSCVCLYNFGSLTTIQLTVVLRTSAVVIRCLCSPLGVLGVPLPSFFNSNNGCRR